MAHGHRSASINPKGRSRRYDRPQKAEQDSDARSVLRSKIVTAPSTGRLQGDCGFTPFRRPGKCRATSTELNKPISSSSGARLVHGEYPYAMVPTLRTRVFRFELG